MKTQLARFGAIGILNTAVDFGLFAFLTSIVHVHFVVANILSTGVALCISFFLNGKLTFNAKLNGKNALLFIATTLVGLWVLQPIVIAVAAPLIDSSLIGTQFHHLGLIIAKLAATGFSLTWNYFLYKHVVFAKANVK